MGHTSLPHRTGHTSRDISMGRKTMCSSTMDHSDGSSTTHFPRCMASSRSRCRSSVRMGFLTLSRRCLLSDGHTVSWQTGCRPALWCPSCLRTGIFLMLLSFLPGHQWQPGLRPFPPLNGMKGSCRICRPGTSVRCRTKRSERLFRMTRAPRPP